MSISAYKRVVRENDSPRDIERRVFSRITSDLMKYGPSYDEAERAIDKQRFLQGGLQLALAENIRLWSVLKMDLLDDGNALPTELRAQLISLALTVERSTSAVLRGEGSVDTLIAINRPIIEGLSGISAPMVAA